MEVAEEVGERRGDPADPGVVFLHGGGQTRHSWGRTAAGSVLYLAVADVLVELLTPDGRRRTEQLEGLAEVRSRLGEPGGEGASLKAMISADGGEAESAVAYGWKDFPRSST